MLTQVPLVIPVFVILVSAFIVVVSIATDPRIEFVFALVMLVLLSILYIPFVHYKLTFNFMGNQLFFVWFSWSDNFVKIVTVFPTQQN